MTKSLLIAAATFALLGAYYKQAESDVTMAEQVTTSVEDPIQASRSAALTGISVAKQGLMDSWRSSLFAGRYRGAKYNASATVRDERARIESIGRAIGAGGTVKSYQLRVDVYRTRRDGSVEDEEQPTFSYRIRPVLTES